MRRSPGQSVVEKNDPSRVLRGQRHGGELSGPKVEAEPFRGRQARVDLLEPRQLGDHGNIEPARSSLVELVDDRRRNPDAPEDLPQPVEGADPAELEER